MSVEIQPYSSTLHPEISEGISFQFTIQHSSGARFSVINYGATITSLFVEDRLGNKDDIVLGFSCLDDYMANGACHGAIVGRHANRIKGAEFSIGEKTFHLPKNDGSNNLHGGSPSFQNIFWNGKVISAKEAAGFLAESHIQNGFEVEGDAVLLTCTSQDGACGFPGNLDVSVMYAWSADRTLLIVYRGESDQDTLFNPTNHAYFNLHGHDSGSVDRHILWLNTKTMTRKDAENIPDGTLEDVSGTIFDFTTPAPIGPTMTDPNPQLVSSKGIDQNYCLSTRHDAVSLTARLAEPDSGRVMEVITNSPGIQVYSGNHIGGYTGKSGTEYVPYGGVCLETQLYPDSIHHPAFPSPILPAHKPCFYITGYRYLLES